MFSPFVCNGGSELGIKRENKTTKLGEENGCLLKKEQSGRVKCQPGCHWIFNLSDGISGDVLQILLK